MADENKVRILLLQLSRALCCLHNCRQDPVAERVWPFRAQEDKPAATATPIFGSAAFGAGGFGSATGFGAATFGGVSTFGSAEKKKAEAEDDAEGEGESADPEAECTATFKPLVHLEEVAVTSGEEDEEPVFEAYALDRVAACPSPQVSCFNFPTHVSLLLSRVPAPAGRPRRIATMTSRRNGRRRAWGPSSC